MKDDNSIVIEFATISDLSDICKCSNENLPISYSIVDFFLFLVDKAHVILVAKNKNEIVGYLLAHYNNKHHTHILSIAVNKQYRKNGTGKKLINYLEKKPIKQITLYVHTENIGAIEFYKKIGFEITATMSNYYDGTLSYTSVQDAYTMTKKIIKVNV